MLRLPSFDRHLGKDFYLMVCLPNYEAKNAISFMMNLL
jgi:hypothetical protein